MDLALGERSSDARMVTITDDRSKGSACRVCSENKLGLNVVGRDIRRTCTNITMDVGVDRFGLLRAYAGTSGLGWRRYFVRSRGKLQV